MIQQGDVTAMREHETFWRPVALTVVSRSPTYLYFTISKSVWRILYTDAGATAVFCYEYVLLIAMI